MLSNQVFLPPPFIGLGPEIFYSKQSPGINFEAINIFRRKLLPSPFRFAFMSVRDSIFGEQTRLVEHARSFGIPFANVCIVDCTNKGAVYTAKSIARILDVLFAPEFSAKVFVSNSIVCNVDWQSALEALERFSESSEPFKGATLKSYAEEVWQKRAIKNSVSLGRF